MWDVQTISVVIAAGSLVLAAANSIWMSRQTQQTRKRELETRQAQLFMQIYDRFNDKEFQKQWAEIMYIFAWGDYDDWAKKYSPFENLDAFASRISIGSYFEGIGVLVKRRLIDPTLVGDLLSSHLILYWEKYGPLLKEARKRMNVPGIGEWQEYLYNQIKPIYEREHPELKK